MIAGGGARPIAINCDGVACMESFRSQERAFMPAIDDAKAAGWAVVKEGGVWMHLCPHHKAIRVKSRGQGLL